LASFSASCHSDFWVSPSDLKVNGHFFAKAGNWRKRHAETTQPSGKSGYKQVFQNVRAAKHFFAACGLVT
jgi:hypothetical protein